MSVLKPRRESGKAHEGKPRSEPERGNPAFRDRRGACGNVATTGAGLRPIGKPLDRPPDPTVACAPHFYPDRFLKLVLPQADSNIGTGDDGHRRSTGAAFSNEVDGRLLAIRQRNSLRVVNRVVRRQREAHTV